MKRGERRTLSGDARVGYRTGDLRGEHGVSAETQEGRALACALIDVFNDPRHEARFPIHTGSAASS